MSEILSHPDVARRTNPKVWIRGFRVPTAFLSVAGFIMVVMALLEIAIVSGFISPYIVARPSGIVVALARGIASGELLYHGAITSIEALSGFAIAIVIGLTIGILVAEIQLMDRAVYPWLVAIQATPKIALAPLFIIWFGFGLSSKIAVATIICLFPIMVMTVSGLRSTPIGLLDTVRSMGASRWQILWLIKFPSALPHIFAGISLASVFSFTGAIVGEFIGASAGLGLLIIDYNSKILIDQSFAALVSVAALGMTFFYAVQAVMKRVLYWNN